MIRYIFLIMFASVFLKPLSALEVPELFKKDEEIRAAYLEGYIRGLEHVVNEKGNTFAHLAPLGSGEIENASAHGLRDGASKGYLIVKSFEEQFSKVKKIEVAKDRLEAVLNELEKLDEKRERLTQEIKDLNKK